MVGYTSSIRWLLSLLLLSICNHVSRVAGSSVGAFTTPPDAGPFNDFSGNKVYQEGQSLTLQWSTQYDSVTIILWQASTSDYSLLTENLQATSYATTVTGSYFKNTSGLVSGTEIPGYVYYFGVYNAAESLDNAANNGDYFTSHYFNISNSGTNSATATSSKPTTFTISTAAGLTEGVAATATPGPSSSASATPVASTGSDDNSSGGLSEGAKVGIGVGVGLGVPLLAAAGVLLFMVLRRRLRQSANQPTVVNHPSVAEKPPAPAGGGDGYYAPPAAMAKQEPSVPMHELPSEPAAELPAEPAAAPAQHGPTELWG